VSLSTEELYTPRIEGFIEKPVQLWEDDSVASGPETCDIAEEPLPTTSDQVNNNQLNVTVNVPSDNFDVSEVLSEQQRIRVENYRSLETPSPKHPFSPIDISVPSISPLIAQHAEDSSLPSISIPSLEESEDTDSKTTENIVYDGVYALDFAGATSPTLLLVPNDKESLVESPQIHSFVVEAEKELSKSEIIEKHDLPRLGNSALTDNEANGTQLLERSSIIVEPKTSEVQENLESTSSKQDIEIKNITVSIETPNFLPKEDIAIRNETRVLEEQCDLSKTVIEDPVPSPTTNIVKKKEVSFEELNRTLTLQEIEDINLTPDEDQYEEFKPQRQSTTLSLSLIKEQPDFEKFRFTAEQVTNELLNPSTDVTEEQFVSATSESKYELHVDVLKIFIYSLYSITDRHINRMNHCFFFTVFQDPSTFDFLLARSNSKHTDTNRLRTESLYIKFDPLVSNISMLPQGNAQPISEEQNGKNESSPPNVGTPKCNPAIAAIDRLLFYSPLPSGAMQKLEETREKIVSS